MCTNSSCRKKGGGAKLLKLFEEMIPDGVCQNTTQQPGLWLHDPSLVIARRTPHHRTIMSSLEHSVQESCWVCWWPGDRRGVEVQGEVVEPELCPMMSCLVPACLSVCLPACPPACPPA